MNEEALLQTPVINWIPLAPLVFVLAGAMLGILIEALVPRRHRWTAQAIFTVTTLLVALGWAIRNLVLKRYALGAGAVAIDGPSHLVWAMLLVFGLLSVLLFAERKLHLGGTVFASSGATLPGSEQERAALAAGFTHSEVFPLALFSLGGMMLFGSCDDLITMFVALEIMSLPLYLLASMSGRRRLLSNEAGLKYFLLGAMSSAVFLFGVALVYGYSASFRLDDIAGAITSPVHDEKMVWLGMAMLAVGLLFKVGAVPFHAWTPDVYQGAPTPVTAFMSVCTKIAAVAGLLRVFYVGLGPMLWDWRLLLAVVAVLTMVVGSVVAVLQTDIKRMLAYSSIAHAGFILTAVVGAVVAVPDAGAAQVTSVGAILFYLIAYGFATIGAFAIVTMVRNEAGEANGIRDWAGFGRRHPFLGAAMAVFLMSFAGIPLTSGFIGKWAVFASAWRGGYWWLVLVAVAMSLVAAYFYLRVVVVMFFTDDVAEGTQAGHASALTWVPLVVAFVATVALGVFPGPLLDLAMNASQFLRSVAQH